jgi:hypothetical protein
MAMSPHSSQTPKLQKLKRSKFCSVAPKFTHQSDIFTSHDDDDDDCDGLSVSYEEDGDEPSDYLSFNEEQLFRLIQDVPGRPVTLFTTPLWFYCREYCSPSDIFPPLPGCAIHLENYPKVPHRTRTSRSQKQPHQPLMQRNATQSDPILASLHLLGRIRSVFPLLHRNDHTTELSEEEIDLLATEDTSNEMETNFPQRILHSYRDSLSTFRDRIESNEVEHKHPSAHLNSLIQPLLEKVCLLFLASVGYTKTEGAALSALMDIMNSYIVKILTTAQHMRWVNFLLIFHFWIIFLFSFLKGQDNRLEQDDLHILLDVLRLVGEGPIALDEFTVKVENTFERLKLAYQILIKNIKKKTQSKWSKIE